MKVYRDLQVAGIACWIDSVDLLPGQRWASVIEGQLGECSHVLVLISKASVGKRGFVQREVNIALDYLLEVPPEDTYVIPARIDDVDPKHRRLLDLHWVDLFPDYDSGLEKITRAIESGTQMAPLKEVGQRSSDKTFGSLEAGAYIQQILQGIADSGLQGQDHYYITFRTNHPEVQIPDHLRNKYPEKITVVLQQDGFDGLNVSPGSFVVKLRFGGVQEIIRVSFDAILEFYNPTTELVVRPDETNHRPPDESLNRLEAKSYIQQILQDTAESGLQGQNHYYITFRTRHPGVRIPYHLWAKYPEEVTVVLQHDFDGLEVGSESFGVKLRFEGVQEMIRVPLDAISVFYNPATELVVRL